MRADPRRVSLRDVGLVALLSVVCLLPFAGKAFHIDDPLFVWLSRHLLEDPLDFFKLAVSWEGSEQPFAAVTKNPPLAAYYMAAASALVGRSEVALHLAFLLPALGVTLGTLGLARRLGADPLLAALACLTFPVFLVSATTLMSDVCMLALFCLSVLLWMRGVEERSHVSLVAGAVLAALCTLTKYFGLGLLPLLFVWSLLRERRLDARVAWLALPLLVLLAYELYTAHLYGRGLLLGSAGWSLRTRPGETGPLERVWIALLFAGGTLAPVLFFAPFARSRRVALAVLGAGTLLLAPLLLTGRIGEAALRGSNGLDANLLAHVAFFAAAAAALVVLVGGELTRRRDAGTWLLGLWILGTFVFAAAVNYTTNGRSLLPMAPPVAVLLARRVGARSAALRYAPLLPAAALSLLVAWGDAAQAGASREAARRIAASYAAGDGTLWFEGSWGFQLYMQEAGARPVDVRRSVLRPGDVLASPVHWKARLGVGPAAANRLETFAIPTAPVTTMAQETATGFYAIQWGPLPYRLRPGYAEPFEVRRLTEYVIFEADPARRAARAAELERALAWMAALRERDARGWPDAGSCRDAFASAAAAADGCGWCATVSECAACVGEGLGDDAPSRACLDRLIGGDDFGRGGRG